MKQVRDFIDIPRDGAYSRIYELQYLYPEFIYNFQLIFNNVFTEIDDSLVVALQRDIDNE